MLSSGSTEIWFQQSYQVCTFCTKKWWFLAFSKKELSNIHQPHLVARQNVTFWRVGQCMSVVYPQIYRNGWYIQSLLNWLMPAKYLTFSIIILQLIWLCLKSTTGFKKICLTPSSWAWHLGLMSSKNQMKWPPCSMCAHTPKPYPLPLPHECSMLHPYHRYTFRRISSLFSRMLHIMYPGNCTIIRILHKFVPS